MVSLSVVSVKNKPTESPELANSHKWEHTRNSLNISLRLPLLDGQEYVTNCQRPVFFSKLANNCQRIKMQCPDVNQL